MSSLQSILKASIPWSVPTIACLLIFIAPALAGERLVLEVHEVGGFRRQPPIRVPLALPRPVPRATPFRLLVDGKPSSAQFRPSGDGEQTDQWWVDFSLPLTPHETRECIVEYGEGVVPLPESKRGQSLRTTADSFVIENAPYITWTVPRDLSGILRSVSFPPDDYLRPGSPGLVLKDRAGGRHPLGGSGVEARVTREGTRTVALRFNGGFEQGALAGVRWTADLSFPSQVSSVEVVLTVDDREGKVAAIGTEMNLNLDPPKPDAPTLVDFGAWHLVYASLEPDEIAELRGAPGPSGPSAVFKGKAGMLVPVATNDPEPPAAGEGAPLRLASEGWAHVMDRRRCLAIAVDRFAKERDDVLTATADGVVSVWREYSRAGERTPPLTKSLRTWMHFVPYPPQQSAATSPRMMQTPARVVVKPG